MNKKEKKSLLGLEPRTAWSSGTRSKNCGAEAHYTRITNVFIQRCFLLFLSCWSKSLPLSLQNTSAVKMHRQKAFFNRFLKRPQLQRDQDSGLPVQVYGLTTPWHSRYRLSWREVVATKSRFQFFLSFDFEKTGSHAGHFFSVLLFQSTLSCLRRNYIHCIDISRLFSSLHSITRNMHSCYSLEKR